MITSHYAAMLMPAALDSFMLQVMCLTVILACPVGLESSPKLGTPSPKPSAHFLQRDARFYTMQNWSEAKPTSHTACDWTRSDLLSS